MSERAIAWAQEQRPPNRTAKFVLMRVAAYADAEGVFWAYVERLADEIMASDRSVQRALRTLEQAGLIRATGRFHHRNVPFYELALRGSFAPSPKSNGDTVTPLNGDSLSPLADRTVTPVSPRTVTQVSPQSRGTHLQEVLTNLSQSARAANDARGEDGFDAAWAAYPDSGLKRTSEPEARAAWRAVLAEGVHPDALLGAVLAYAADPQLKRGDHGACSLQRWLVDRRWRSYLARPAAAAPPVPAAVPGLPTPPSDLRAAFVEEFGDAFAASYWPAGWVGEATLVSRTATACDRLRRDCRAWLAERGLTVITAAEAATSEIAA